MFTEAVAVSPAAGVENRMEKHVIEAGLPMRVTSLPDATVQSLAGWAEQARAS